MSKKEMRKVLFIIAAIILFFLPYSHQAITHVSSCPSDKQSWKQISSAFFCEHPHEEYHCIQNVEHGLIETCMTVYSIPFYKVGCPWVKINNGKAYLRNPFTPCDPTHTGCPEQFHRRYRSNELYIYPECIQIGNINTSYTTDSVEDETTNLTFSQDKHDGLSTTIITGCLAFLLGCIIVIIVVTYYISRSPRRKSNENYVKVQDQNRDQEEMEHISDSKDHTMQKPAINEPKCIMLETTTRHRKAIPKECSRKLDGLNANKPTAHYTTFQATTQMSRPAIFYQNDIDTGSDDLHTSSTDDENTPLVKIKKPFKLKRHHSDPIKIKLCICENDQNMQLMHRYISDFHLDKITNSRN